MASSSKWTTKENKRFENALAMIGTEEISEEGWEKVAKSVGNGKTVEDVKRHYERLVEDVKLIEQGLVPLPNYSNITSTSYNNTNNNNNFFHDQHQRFQFFYFVFH